MVERLIVGGNINYKRAKLQDEADVENIVRIVNKIENSSLRRKEVIKSSLKDSKVPK